MKIYIYNTKKMLNMKSKRTDPSGTDQELREKRMGRLFEGTLWDIGRRECKVLPHG